MNKNNNYSGDFPAEEETSDETTVDWDAEWKKVVANKDRPIERPGKDYYKTEAELAAIRAANEASKRAQKMTENLPQMPSWLSLQSNWKVRALILWSCFGGCAVTRC